MPPSIPYAAVMGDYCLVPPYVAKPGVMPNITVVYEKGADIVKGAYYGIAYDSTKTYYGFFKSTANYQYNTASEYFEQPAGACTPTGTNNCFSGNLLNWALMSSLDLARKALIGFGWNDETPSAGDVFTYSGNFCDRGNDWTSNGTVCSDQTRTPISYTDLEDGNNKCVNANVTIGGTDYSIAFEVKQTGETPAKLKEIKYKNGYTSGAPSCSGSYTNILGASPGDSGGKIAMKITDEPRTGLIQKYADKDSNYQYDTNVPRFGVKRWNSGAAQQEDIIRDSPSLSLSERSSFFRNLISAISKSPGTDPSTAYLGAMHKQIVNYYKGSSSTYEDNDSLSQTPYNWATDPLKACRKTYALYVTTGTYLGQESDKLTPLPLACSSLSYTDAFPTNTCYAYNTDLYTTDGSPPKQNISTYVVHTTFYGAGAANEAKLTYAANVSDGEYLKVDDPNKFEQVLEQAILDMLNRAASGTAASVLASGEGSGANLFQAVFYPKTPRILLGGMFEKRIDWAGRLSNLWYYVDPFFSTSSIYDDYSGGTPDKKLNISGVSDRTVKTCFIASPDTVTISGKTYQDVTIACLNSASCSSSCSTPVLLENIVNLWEAGVQLWNRNLSTTPRTIYTTINGSSFLSNNFSPTNKTILKDYLQASTNDESEAIIRYIQGEDNPVVSGTTYSYRSRTTKIDLNGDGDTSDTVNGISENQSNVWKLGDIMNSTPRISSWIQLNTYDSIYSDTTYSDFVNSSTYTNRGMVFTGANDGMLHAFKLGELGLPNSSHTAGCSFVTNEKACLSGSDLGKEIWAFIPKNVLPYLKYLTETSYCHLYTVNLSPYIFDASINGNPDDTKTGSSWRTILIGGMGFGGACKYSGSSCSGGGSDCVKSPVSDNGLSSYFALDITDQNNPTLLWEFSSENLGFSSTSPAIVRIGSDKTKNGKWFVVFSSGPTGPISTSDYQFLGRSDQNLRLFVLDLKTGEIARTIDTAVTNAFAGSMLNATHDSDLDYQDDVLYIPYVKKTGSEWRDGGVLRLSTKENTSPSAWEVSIVKDGIGPVTSSIVKLQNNSKKRLWLYFGTGRYIFKQSTVDDPSSQRKLYGVLDPCFSSTTGVFLPNCTDSVSGSLTDVTNDPSADPETVASSGGWYINLDPSATGYGSERVITDPLSTTAGYVFFTTYKPYTDVCSIGGKTYLWAVRYSTGGAPGDLLKGVALIQTSTAAIEQVSLSEAFTEKEGRRTSAMEGVPPTSQGLSLLTTPPPVKRIIHMRER
jgi:type IV pilus assembly protein PilY1